MVLAVRGFESLLFKITAKMDVKARSHGPVAPLQPVVQGGGQPKTGVEARSHRTERML